MKKFALVLISCLLISGVSFSQLHFGPKIGYNTSKLSTDLSDVTSELKNNFHFGVFLRVGEKFYFQPEINWMTQGGVFKSPSWSTGISPIKQEIDLKTIEIPALVGWRLINLEIVNIRIMAGPSAAIVTDKTIETNSATDPIKEADIGDLLWGFQIGAGVDVLMFSLDVRYNAGLNNIINDITIDGETNTISSKANGFNVSLGWKIF